MLNEVTTDFQSAVTNTFNTNGLMALALMLGIALYMGLRMSKMSEFFTRSVVGLVILGLVIFIIGGVSSDEPFSLTQWDHHGAQAWNSMMSMSLLNILGYLSCFAVLILGVHTIKGLARK